MPILTSCPLCFDCINNWNRNKTKKVHWLTLEKVMMTANAIFQVHVHNVLVSVMGSTLWCYLKWNVFLFPSAFRLSDCCKRKGRRIMQTGPSRQVQDVIHSFTALINMHAVQAVLRQPFSPVMKDSCLIIMSRLK